MKLASRSDEYLIKSLKRVLYLVGLPTDFSLELRGYSVGYDGKYLVDKNRVFIYHLEKDNSLRHMDSIIKTAIHEAVHHYQYNYQEGFKRYKGIMHDPAFIHKYKECVDRAVELNILTNKDEEERYEII